MSVSEYLKEKRNFVKVGTVAFGVPFATGAHWMVGAYGGVAWWLFLVVLALVGSWVWASLMWLALEGDIRRSPSDSAASNVDDEQSKEPGQPR